MRKEGLLQLAISIRSASAQRIGSGAVQPDLCSIPRQSSAALLFLPGINAPKQYG
jgi:hypothetical protein